MEKAKCEQCGIIFIKKAGNQRYCGMDCRKNADKESNKERCRRWKQKQEAKKKLIQVDRSRYKKDNLSICAMKAVENQMSYGYYMAICRHK